MQAFAVHYGLNKYSTEILQHLELSQIASFSFCDPDGTPEQQAVFTQSVEMFTSPISKAKFKSMVQRICSSDPFIAVPVHAPPPAPNPPPAASGSGRRARSNGAPPVAASGEAAAVSGAAAAAVSGAAAAASAGASAAGASTSGASTSGASTSRGAAAGSAAAARSRAAGRISYSSSSSDNETSDSDSDDDPAGGGGPAAKKSKSGKADGLPKDANAMVDEMASPTLDKRWRQLLKLCKTRVECNTDSGDCSLIVHALKKVISASNPKHFDGGDKKILAKRLRTALNSVHMLVQGHASKGGVGVASVIFQELSGLAGSSMIRRVSKALKDSAGVARGARGGRGAPSAYENPSPLSRPSFPSRGGFQAMRQNYLNRFQRGGGGGNRVANRADMQCFECLQFGHGARECPTKVRSVPSIPRHVSARQRISRYDESQNMS